MSRHFIQTSPGKMAACEQEQSQRGPVKKTKQKKSWCYSSIPHATLHEVTKTLKKAPVSELVLCPLFWLVKKQQKWHFIKTTYITPPLQKSTITSPGLLRFVTIATKLFSCCCFLKARSLDIFPEDDKGNRFTVTFLTSFLQYLYIFN